MGPVIAARSCHAPLEIYDPVPHAAPPANPSRSPLMARSRGNPLRFTFRPTLVPMGVGVSSMLAERGGQRPAQLAPRAPTRAERRGQSDGKRRSWSWRNNTLALSNIPESRRQALRYFGELERKLARHGLERGSSSA